MSVSYDLADPCISPLTIILYKEDDQDKKAEYII